MKIHYFFISADLKFYKQHVNPSYDYDPTDHADFTQKEIYGIEQTWDENDAAFFQNLKHQATAAVDAWAQDWCKKNTKENKGYKWIISKLEVTNISKVS